MKGRTLRQQLRRLVGDPTVGQVAIAIVLTVALMGGLAAVQTARGADGLSVAEFLGGGVAAAILVVILIRLVTLFKRNG